MRKILLLSLVFVPILILSGCGNKQNQNVGNIVGEIVVDSECQSFCADVIGVCPSLLSSEQCERNCGSWDDSVREKIGSAENCAEMSSIEEVVLSLVPKFEEPNLPPSNNDCEAACGSYVGKCLTLVPNATQALFNEGLSSCISECEKWNAQKVECMISAFDCEAMTNVCGL